MCEAFSRFSGQNGAKDEARATRHVEQQQPPEDGARPARNSLEEKEVKFLRLCCVFVVMIRLWKNTSTKLHFSRAGKSTRTI